MQSTVACAAPNGAAGGSQPQRQVAATPLPMSGPSARPPAAQCRHLDAPPAAWICRHGAHTSQQPGTLCTEKQRGRAAGRAVQAAARQCMWAPRQLKRTARKPCVESRAPGWWPAASRNASRASARTAAAAAAATATASSRLLWPRRRDMRPDLERVLRERGSRGHPRQRRRPSGGRRRAGLPGAAGGTYSYEIDGPRRDRCNAKSQQATAHAQIMGGGAIKNPSGRGGRANGSHRPTMTLAYALPAARSALPPCRSAGRARHLRSRRVAVRAASDRPFDLQQHLEATVAE